MGLAPHALIDVPRDALLQAMCTFDATLREQREWQGWTDNQAYKYAIFHDFKLYPVKTIVSLSTGIPVQQFSGGNQANSSVTRKGFNVISLRAFSWIVESGSVAKKVLDKSAFLHRGTGIPIETRPFFMGTDLSAGQKAPLVLVFEGEKYDAHIDMDRQDTPRSQLLWGADFAKLLKRLYPYHYERYERDEQIEAELMMRFERLNGFATFNISFLGQVPTDIFVDDIASEQVEERGPSTEGGTKEYFGKRYERSPANRRMAIQVHGITCNACGFNFEAVYGARGADYIEVHHLKPISTYTSEQYVDPTDDLTTLCANCHRMIHRHPDEILSLEQLRSIIRGMPEL